ncbi:peptidylprolyl isomerase [Streptomyces spongiicola]|uniref:Peptidylprolyl isomerase n=1 Tax=Streptomyces spongiicola TaxID=1690221 RepID=A0A2S1YVH7_9ACTN|nr:peptidylprolyl isomerase [Streptomyces spongiicola]AWK07738.1 peptidylprolyl isomerase [Streptomyces spongiicola]GBQ03128.1 peptidylprolyl isomerase [Streptomyces spongiicola]
MVSSDQRRRQLARKKFERQQQRRQEARRKARRRNAVIAAGLAVVVAAGGAAYLSVGLADGGSRDDASQRTDPAPAESESGAPEPKMAIDAGATYRMSMDTSQGAVAFTMDAAKTPRTVNSFKYLADKGFFDGTTCHRLTTEGIFVLQCGDPQGDGTGGPGYTIPDENLTALGKPAADGKVTYPAGTVAMANTGQPDSGGSQFFLVYKDTKLPPSYTPFGTIDEAGLSVVKAVGAAGVAGGAGDGAPAKSVSVKKAAVSKG